MNRPHMKEPLCKRCEFAKDKVFNQYSQACYCVKYGFIVSRMKERCKGFKHEQIQERKDNA